MLCKRQRSLKNSIESAPKSVGEQGAIINAIYSGGKKRGKRATRMPQVTASQDGSTQRRPQPVSRHTTRQQNLRLGKRAQIERKINGQFDSPVWDSHRTAKKLSLFICEYAKRSNDDAPPRHHLPVPAQDEASFSPLSFSCEVSAN